MKMSQSDATCDGSFSAKKKKKKNDFDIFHVIKSRSLVYSKKFFLNIVIIRKVLVRKIRCLKKILRTNIRHRFL